MHFHTDVRQPERVWLTTVVTPVIDTNMPFESLGLEDKIFALITSLSLFNHFAPCACGPEEAGWLQNRNFYLSSYYCQELTCPKTSSTSKYIPNNNQMTYLWSLVSHRVAAGVINFHSDSFLIPPKWMCSCCTAGTGPGAPEFSWRWWRMTLNDTV